VAVVLMVVGQEMFLLPGNFDLLLTILGPWSGKMK